ncbi:MAG: DNA polymerase IV [Actinomycetota bacterium]
MAWDTPILHADLDAFYASVEQMRDPSLRDRPVIVAGASSRGVVTSASYEARRFGVRSAMPTSRARRLCPAGIFLPPDFDAYKKASGEVHEIFTSFSPVVEPLGMDEAFLDLQGASRLWKKPDNAAGALRKTVRGETGLNVSIGVAANKFLAKVASRHAKPDGLLVVDPVRAEDWLGGLGIGELWGVGEQTTLVLKRLGLKTIGDIRKVPRPTMEKVLGPLGLYISALASGRDDRPVLPQGAGQKSIGAERTFEHDLAGAGEALSAVLALSDRVGSRLRASGSSARTITLKVRMANFSTFTRSTTLSHQVDATLEIYGPARDLLLRFIAALEHRAWRIRLLGISVSKLSSSPGTRQLSLEKAPEWALADRAVDGIRKRFGNQAAGFAGMLAQ